MSLGYLIATLATEYKVRTDGGADTSGTVRDLYHAIQTFNRLDRNAEAYFGGSPDLNGFFIRDDVPSTLIGDTDPYFNSPAFSQLTVTNVRSGQAEGVPTEMTHDQVWPLFLGLALVSKLVPDTVKFQGISLAGEARDIVRRIILPIREYKTFSGPKEVFYRIKVAGKEKEFKASAGPWLILNPVTGRCPSGIYDNPTCDNAGAFVVWLSYGAAEAACKIVHGFTPGRTVPTPEFCEFHDRYSLTTGMAVWEAVRQVRLNREEDFKFQILAAVSDGWPHSKLVKRSSFHKYEILPLVNAVLYDRTPGVPRDAYDCFLNTAPCRWPYNWGDGAYPHYDWSSTSRFFSLGDYPGTRKPHFDGEYNGLDYMLLYNLYRIAYGSVGQPATAARCDCFVMGKGKAKRVCKKLCRQVRHSCKGDCKKAKRTCFSECPKKGKAKRDCRRDCRKKKRECVRSCRTEKRGCTKECRTAYRYCGG